MHDECLTTIGDKLLMTFLKLNFISECQLIYGKIELIFVKNRINIRSVSKINLLNGWRLPAFDLIVSIPLLK